MLGLGSFACQTCGVRTWQPIARKFSHQKMYALAAKGFGQAVPLLQAQPAVAG